MEGRSPTSISVIGCLGPGKDYGQRYFAPLGHQNVISTTGCLVVHALDPDPARDQAGDQLRRCKSLPRAGADGSFGTADDLRYVLTGQSEAEWEALGTEQRLSLWQASRQRPGAPGSTVKLIRKPSSLTTTIRDLAGCQ